MNQQALRWGSRRPHERVKADISTYFHINEVRFELNLLE